MDSGVNTLNSLFKHPVAEGSIADNLQDACVSNNFFSKDDYLENIAIRIIANSQGCTGLPTECVNSEKDPGALYKCTLWEYMVDKNFDLGSGSDNIHSEFINLVRSIGNYHHTLENHKCVFDNINPTIIDLINPFFDFVTKNRFGFTEHLDIGSYNRLIYTRKKDYKINLKKVPEDNTVPIFMNIIPFVPRDQTYDLYFLKKEYLEYYKGHNVIQGTEIVVDYKLNEDKFLKSFIKKFQESSRIEMEKTFEMNDLYPSTVGNTPARRLEHYSNIGLKGDTNDIISFMTTCILTGNKNKLKECIGFIKSDDFFKEINKSIIDYKNIYLVTKKFGFKKNNRTNKIEKLNEWMKRMNQNSEDISDNVLTLIKNNEPIKKYLAWCVDVLNSRQLPKNNKIKIVMSDADVKERNNCTQEDKLKPVLSDADDDDQLIQYPRDISVSKQQQTSQSAAIYSATARKPHSDQDMSVSKQQQTGQLADRSSATVRIPSSVQDRSTVNNPIKKNGLKTVRINPNPALNVIYNRGGGQKYDINELHLRIREFINDIQNGGKLKNEDYDITNNIRLVKLVNNSGSMKGGGPKISSVTEKLKDIMTILEKSNIRINDDDKKKLTDAYKKLESDVEKYTQLILILQYISQYNKSHNATDPNIQQLNVKEVIDNFEYIKNFMQTNIRSANTKIQQTRNSMDFGTIEILNSFDDIIKKSFIKTDEPVNLIEI